MAGLVPGHFFSSYRIAGQMNVGRLAGD